MADGHGESANPEGRLTTPHSNDLEKNSITARQLRNETVDHFSWRDVSVNVKHRKTGEVIPILQSSHGYVQAGQVLALMGPSGSGKTTLLNVLAQRLASNNAEVSGEVLVGGRRIARSRLQQLSSYVEQEDALIGSLTVSETISFAARLAMGRSTTKTDRQTRVKELIESFGLQGQANTIVGTPIQKGISGGQKRRLSVASQLVTSPSILFLDEPTSGLDSTASREVMGFIAEIARQHRMVVIASIHQPSTATYELFDRVILLSGGQSCFFGQPSETAAYFAKIGRPMPIHTNPAEFMLDLVNTDFGPADTQTKVQQIHQAWSTSPERTLLLNTIAESTTTAHNETLHEHSSKATLFTTTTILLHRNFLKSYRDLLAYGTRVAMYIGLAIMMGTVWLRLHYTQTSIQPFINALFFGGAFMSFMAVAYVPAIIEDLHTFRKERANGLYGPLPFTIANFIIGIPYLFLIALLFSIITYWLCNFRNSATGFWMYVLWLFLDLLAAEGLVVLVTSVAPIFVVALAVTAFANGLWMAVGGFLVPLGTLNVFWKYVFHYIDYQAYVFQGMMVNQFRDTTYSCGGKHCMYASDLQGSGRIDGRAVLEAYHYAHSNGEVGKWLGIMVAIILVYRLFGWAVLVVNRG